MKGVVLADGAGAELRPLTRVTSTYLLPVGGRPMVTYAIDALVAAGIGEILLVIDGEYAGDFLRLLSDGEAYGVHRLLYAHRDARDGALRPAARFADGECVCVLRAATILGRSIAPHAEMFLGQPGGARVLLGPVAGTNGAGPATRRRYTAVGVSFYDERFAEAVAGLDDGRPEIAGVDHWFAARGAARYGLVDGFWRNAGRSLADYHAADDFVRANGANRDGTASAAPAVRVRRRERALR